MALSGTLTRCAAWRWSSADRSASGVIEPGDFRHHAIEQVEDAIGFGHEGRQALAPVHAFGGPVLVEHPRARGRAIPRAAGTPASG